MKRSVVLVIALACSAMSQSPAQAEPAAVTIDGRTPPLKKSDAGGWTAELGLTNLTDAPLTIRARNPDSTDPSSCHPTVDKATLPSAEHTAVVVTFPTACTLRERHLDFAVDVTASSEQVATFDLTATEAKATAPPWNALWAFLAALALMAVAAIVGFWRWDPPGNTKRRLRTPLTHVAATWSFKDSWVNNVTLAAGLVTGIFGSSETLKAMLGDQADASVALATVSAAIAAAMIAAAPVLLMATKTRKGDHFTGSGLLAAAALTLGAAFGELFVLCYATSKLDLGGWQHWVWVPGGLAALLLGVYAYRSLRQIFDVGSHARRAKKSHRPSGASDPGGTRQSDLQAVDLSIGSREARPAERVREPRTTALL